MKTTFKKRSALCITAGALAVASALSSVVSANVPMTHSASIKPTYLTKQENVFERRVIVKYKEGMTSNMMRSFGAKTLSTKVQSGVTHVRSMADPQSHVIRVEANSDEALEDILSMMRDDPNIEYAEEDRLLHAFATPNDEQYAVQWHYFESAGGLNVPGAWDLATGNGVVVAVLDTGYRPHVDLNANILPGYDMISEPFVGNDGDGRDGDALDPGDWTRAGECGQGFPQQDQPSSWHGTHVAGTIAAVTNNNRGIAGVAYNAKIVPVRVLGKCGGLMSDIADAIIWASGGNVNGVPTNPNPADVINMSLGGQSSCTATMQSAINQAHANGSVVVVAAGNSNADASGFEPASCNGVINVAATNRSGGRSNYSNFGNSIDVAAPGGQQAQFNDPNGILSTLNSGSTVPQNDNYAYFQGTSMAAPHVAGVAALIREVRPNSSHDEVESILKQTAREFGVDCSVCGDGIVDAEAAVKLAMGNVDDGGNNNEVLALTNGQMIKNLKATVGEQIQFTLEVPEGAKNLTFDMSGTSGDADLYVKLGAAPTNSDYDCRPYIEGSNEVCSDDTPVAGTYYVTIVAYKAFTNASLVANYEIENDGDHHSTVKIREDLASARGRAINYRLEIPTGTSFLKVTTSGGSGDVDLSVRLAGLSPWFSCMSADSGNNEVCEFFMPPAGTWNIQLRAYETFQGVTLRAEYQ